MILTFNQTVLKNGSTYFCRNIQILFDKKSDARKFVKMTKADFLLASRNANLFQLTYGNTCQEKAQECFFKFKKHFEEIKKVAKIVWHNGEATAIY